MTGPGLSAAIEAGELAELRADYIEAIAAYQLALDDRDPLVVADAQFRLGRVAWRMGNYARALESFDLARATATRHGAAELRSRAEIGVGNVHYAHGDYARARAAYEGALRLNPDLAVRGMVLLNLGVIANIEGELDRALESYTESRDAFAAAEDMNGEAQALHNLGVLHAARLDWDASEASYTACVALCELTGNREMIARVWMNRSELSCQMGRYAEAVDRCDAALAIFAEIGAEVPRGTTLRWKGRALRELGQLAAAEKSLLEAMRIAHRCRARQLEAEAMQELGSTALLQGDRHAAHRWLERALALYETLGARREIDEVRADLSALDFT